jgi:aerobic carbon-monoxide dehydrogenase small subunit
LVDYLKDELGSSDIHIGCMTGECGACTVTLNGMAVKSCMMLAVQVHDSDVLTVSGLIKGGQPHPIIESFFEVVEPQCGFCKPGMIMAAYALLQRNPTPSEEQIRWALHGNLCRCLGFGTFVRAVQHASHKMLAAPGW